MKRQSIDNQFRSLDMMYSSKVVKSNLYVSLYLSLLHRKESYDRKNQKDYEINNKNKRKKPF